MIDVAMLGVTNETRRVLLNGSANTETSSPVDNASVMYVVLMRVFVVTSLGAGSCAMMLSPT